MKNSIIICLFIIAIPFAANATEIKAEAADASHVVGVNIQEEVAKAGVTMNHIAQGPKNSFEVAALFNLLEHKGIINKDELSKEIHSLNIESFSDPDPYVLTH